MKKLASYFVLDNFGAISEGMRENSLREAFVRIMAKVLRLFSSVMSNAGVSW